MSDGIVAVYARVSTDEQAERQTIEAQLTACREFCRHKGWDIAVEFRDEGVSGAKPLDERREGKRLLEAAEDKGRVFDSVVVYRLDRLGRDALQCLLAIERLKRRGVKVESVNETFDETPAGDFARTVMSAVAQLERDLIRERTTEGRKRRAMNGKFSAAVAPFGFDWDRTSGHLSINETTAVIVRDMYRWAIEGLGLKRIADRLDELGIKPPSLDGQGGIQSNWGWHIATVYNILTNRRYIGEASYAGIHVPCPSIVDEITFARAQSAMTARRQNSPRNTKHAYLLQHMLYCRACGSRYCVQTTTRGPYEWATYYCYQRRSYRSKAEAVHNGVRWSWPAHEIEDIVKTGVRKVLFDPSFYIPNLEVEVERIRADVASAPSLVADLEKKIADLDAQETRVLDWGQLGIVDQQSMLRRLEGIKTERWQLTTALKTAKEEAIGALDMVESAELFLELARGIGTSSEFIDVETGQAVDPTPEQWRAHIERVAERIWVEPDGRVTIEGVGGVSVYKTSWSPRDTYRLRYRIRLDA